MIVICKDAYKTLSGGHFASQLIYMYKNNTNKIDTLVNKQSRDPP